MKEITSPLKSPLQGYRKPAKKRTPPSGPILRDDPTAHVLLNYFRERIGTELDGYFKTNYDACEELIARCRKQGSDPEQVIRTLIDVATNDKWYGPKATSFRYLVLNAVAIFRSHRAQFEKTSASSLSTALQAADQRFSEQQGGGGPDPGPGDTSGGVPDA